MPPLAGGGSGPQATRVTGDLSRGPWPTQAVDRTPPRTAPSALLSHLSSQPPGHRRGQAKDRRRICGRSVGTLGCSGERGEPGIVTAPHLRPTTTDQRDHDRATMEHPRQALRDNSTCRSAPHLRNLRGGAEPPCDERRHHGARRARQAAPQTQPLARGRRARTTGTSGGTVGNDTQHRRGWPSGWPRSLLRGLGLPAFSGATAPSLTL